MPRILRYLSHPQVVVDRLTPVPEWPLSTIGVQRIVAFSNAAVLAKTGAIFSSGERKAIETATIISEALNLPLSIRARTHENDRSGTGFLEPAEFERVADQFFASPTESVRGWETALDAQSRIVSETKRIISEKVSGDVLMVGHGGVGTLLLCHFSGFDIARKYDQPHGGGNMFAYDIERRTIVHSWVPIEEF